MATAPNVIPRSKVTWESPKKKRKTQWRLPLTALVLAITNRAENLCYQFKQG